MSEPTEKGGDSPPSSPESPTSDDEQFQRDLLTAIQRSIEETYGTSNQPAASTSGTTVSSLSDDEDEEEVVDDKPTDQPEEKASDQESDQGDESSPVDSGEEKDSKKETGTDSPVGSLSLEEVQYLRDMQAAIQRSIQDVYKRKKYPAASTSAVTGSSSEEESDKNSADDNKERAVDNQTNVQEQKEATKEEDDREEEPSKEDSDGDSDSVKASSVSDDESDEHAADDKPNDQEEEKAVEEKDGQENQSSPGESDEEQNGIKPKETDLSDIPLLEDVHFQKDLQTAIQRSIVEFQDNRMEPVPSTSGITNIRNQRSTQKWDSKKTLTDSSSEDEDEDSDADVQPNRQEKPQTIKQENDEEEEHSSGDPDTEYDSLNGSSGDEDEKNETDDKTVKAVGSQTDIQEETQPLLEEGDEEEESSSGDNEKETEENESPKEERIDNAPRRFTPEEIQFHKDMQTAIQRSLQDAYGPSRRPGVTITELTDSSSEEETKEDATDDKTVKAVGSQTDIQEESQSLLQQDDEEEEDSGKEIESPKETEVDSPPGILSPEEIQFQKDLQTAIQRSLEEACVIKIPPAVISYEFKNSKYQHPSDTGHSSKTFTRSFAENIINERKAGGLTVRDADNQTYVQEEAQAGEGEDDQQKEPPLEDSDINSGDCGLKHDKNTGRRSQRDNSPAEDVAEKSTRFAAARDTPLEIDPDAPRRPVGEGALKKTYRRPTAEASSSADADAAQIRVSRRTAQSVWQYPQPKRLAFTDEFPTEQQIVTDETRSVSRNAAVSGTETRDSMQGLKTQQQQPLDFYYNSRRRWSKPLPVCPDNIAYLQAQKTSSDESETRNIFEEIQRWEIRQRMEANRRSSTLMIKPPAPKRDNSQKNVKNDNQQPPSYKEASERCNLRYVRQPPAAKDSNKVIDLKVPQFSGQQMKKTINTEQPKQITGNESCKKDAQDPQSSTRPVIVSAVLKKDEPASPSNTKETSTVEEQNNTYTDLLLRDIVRVYFEKKSPPSEDRPGSSVQQKYKEPQVAKEKSPPFNEKVKNCSGSKVSKLPVPLRATGIPIKSTGKQTLPKDEIRIQEMTEKLLEDTKETDLNKTPECNIQKQGLEIKETDLNEAQKCNIKKQGLEIKEVDPNETQKCNTEEGLVKTHQEQQDGNVSEYEEQQISEIKTICDETVQITPSDDDSAEFDNKFNKLLTICVDEKEMSERLAEATGKFSSDHCKKIRYIRRRTKSMDKRNFTADSTVYDVESDAPAKQENEVLVDEKQLYYTGTNIKSDIQSYQKAFSKEKHMEEMQASQYRYTHGKKLQQKPIQFTTGEKEMTVKTWKGKIFRKNIQSRQIPGTVAVNISGQKPVSSNRRQLDFLRMVPIYYQNGCAKPEGDGSVDTVPLTAADVEDELYLDELTDSFDIIKQDISVIHEDILRRALIYGYMRSRRRRMASAHRSKRLQRLADKQSSDTAQPKTGYLRRVPSVSWKGQLQNKTLYEQIRKRWFGKPADGTTQMDNTSSSELQKFTRSVSGRFVRWCSCKANTNLHNDQHSPSPQIQGPPNEIQPGEMDKETQVPDQQPIQGPPDEIQPGEMDEEEEEVPDQQPGQ